ncbi:MAG: class I SAM-dependent methyltransferase [Paracoccaceae bacterium]|jgi:SAM-dependent methyltransferase
MRSMVHGEMNRSQNVKIDNNMTLKQNLDLDTKLMTFDTETIQVYETLSEKYSQLSGAKRPIFEVSFIDKMPPNGKVLDLGCGHGAAAANFVSKGLRVEAWDASKSMQLLAQRLFNLNVTLKTFEDLTSIRDYDGIYANFSLLHAPKDDFIRHLSFIHKALKVNGVFHLALKLGEGSHRDELGRFYSYYQESELCRSLMKAGFWVKDKFEGEHKGLTGKVEPWIALQSQKIEA